jgi:hypothetical protein
MKSAWLLCLFALTSCAAPQNQVAQDDLFATFDRYQNLVAENNKEAIVDMISVERRPIILKSERLLQLIIGGLTGDMVSLDSKYQAYASDGDKQTGCLTINYYREENKPATVSIGFVKEQGAWKMDAFMFSGGYLTDKRPEYYEKRFTDRATCTNKHRRYNPEYES